MEIISKILATAIVGISAVAIIAGVALLIAFPVKWTWNATMPYLFALPTLTWGKAWCLHFLCDCLIKSSHTHKG